MDSLLPLLHERQGLAAVTRLTWQTPLPAEPDFGLFLITLGGGCGGCTLQPAYIGRGQSKRVGFLLPCRSYRLNSGCQAEQEKLLLLLSHLSELVFGKRFHSAAQDSLQLVVVLLPQPHSAGITPYRPNKCFCNSEKCSTLNIEPAVLCITSSKKGGMAGESQSQFSGIITLGTLKCVAKPGLGEPRDQDDVNKTKDRHD